jgi:protein TonB
MEEARMDFSQNEVSPLRRYGGLGIVVFVHALVAYALVTGLAHKMVDMIKAPVETKIIEEVKPPPPPDTPPPPPPPKMVAPPPPFIPPPEVNITPPPSQNVIQATTSQTPVHQEFAKAVEAPKGPVAQPGPSVPVLSDLNSCKPAYPPAAQRAEEEGTVRIQFVVGPNGQLAGTPTVLKSSGSKNLDKAAVSGLARCTFKPAYKDGKPVEAALAVDYVWKLGE